MNRKCEFLLREVEFLSSVALFTGADKNFQYPSVELARLWKLLLLNQFHDVLPGSSITLVSLLGFRPGVLVTQSHLRLKINLRST